MLPLSMSEQDDLAKLLDLVLQTNEFSTNVRRINVTTAQLAEEMMADVVFCSRASAALFAALRCIPKSRNIVGWLLGCLPGVLEVVRHHGDHLMTNLLCHNPIRAKYYSALILSLL